MKKFKKINVMIVSNSFWNIINYRENLLKTLVSKYNVFLVATNDLKNSKSYLKKYRCNYIDLNFHKRKTNIFSEFFTFYKLIKLLNCKIDIILSFTIKPNIYGSLIARIFNIPIINNITGLGMYHSKSFFSEMFVISFTLLH